MMVQDNLAEQRTRYRNELNTLASRYVVSDIIPDTASFIFLLESPHVQELKYGAPVCGLSGASMTRHLFGAAYEKQPLGIIVKKNLDEQLHRPSLDKVGLMNVCNIPMQRAAYDEASVVGTHSDLLEILEGLRTAGSTERFADANWTIVHSILLDSLRHRLEQLWDRTLYLVPCGRFAQKYFQLAGIISPNWQVVRDIPHPSYNNWSKPRYRAGVDALVTMFQTNVRREPWTL